jgi:hypothetical protein
MGEIDKKGSNGSGEHLSDRIDAPAYGTVKPDKIRIPKSAGNKSFRRHNNLRFMITERRRELGKG